MTITVADLVAHPDTHTRSLTPGVGGDRKITWAHVCELTEPWRWLGEGTLVMTTGIAVPDAADDQRAYLAGMAEAGIAALAVDEEVSIDESALIYAAAIGFPVLVTAANTPFITLAHVIAEHSQLGAIEDAAHRRYWMLGTILLDNLLDGVMPPEGAEPLLVVHRITVPFVLGTWLATAGNAELERVQGLLASHEIPALVTFKEEYVLMAVNESAIARLDPIVEVVGSIGLSAAFHNLSAFSVAARQSQVALARARGGTPTIMRFDTDSASSLFLPEDQGRLRAIARQVLGPLWEYDQNRGTELVHTLRVFLEENRSWVRSARRLYVHRQTLAARIARIESVLNRDFSSTEDTADCWFGIRAAILCGEIDPFTT